MTEVLLPGATAPQSRSTVGQRLAAGAVHIYTASGSVIGLLIVLAAIRGQQVEALALMLLAMVIDGTDGMLARRLAVTTHIPWFDGARLDDIVDYLTYVFAPVVLLWNGGYLPDGTPGLLLAAVPLLASSYQFCRVDAKTEDHFFLGFPSYWNVVAFYAVVFGLGEGTVAVILLLCAVLVFVPIRYLYPSRTEAYWQLNLALTVVWLVTYGVILAQMPEPGSVWLAISLIYVVYYAVMSVYLTLRKNRNRRSNPDAAGVE